MNELLSGLALGPDAASLGADAGIILAVNEATNILKEDIRRWGWEPVCARLYPGLPFVLAFGLALLLGNRLWPDAVSFAARIGVLANFAFRVHRVTVRGK